MKNKIVVLMVIIGLTCLANKASSDTDAMLSAFRKQYVSMLPFYKNMQTCTPYKFNDSFNGTYQIYGKVGNTCKVAQPGKVCKYPLNVSQQYGLTLANYYKQVIVSIDNKKEISVSTDDPVTQKAYRLDQQYCLNEVKHYENGKWVTKWEKF